MQRIAGDKTMTRINQGKAIRVEIANGITAKLQLLSNEPEKLWLAPTLSPSDGNTRFAPPADTDQRQHREIPAYHRSE